jgi:hypothetical protein
MFVVGVTFFGGLVIAALTVEAAFIAPVIFANFATEPLSDPEQLMLAVGVITAMGSRKVAMTAEPLV